MTPEELRELCRVAERQEKAHGLAGVRAIPLVQGLLAAASEIDRLRKLESNEFAIVREQDGYEIGVCPVCGTEHVVGDALEDKDDA